MTGIGTTLAIALGIAAAVLFVIAIAVYEGYLGVANLYAGTTAQAFAVYGVIALIGAIGANAWDSHESRR